MSRLSAYLPFNVRLGAFRNLSESILHLHREGNLEEGYSSVYNLSCHPHPCLFSTNRRVNTRFSVLSLSLSLSLSKIDAAKNPLAIF